MENANLILRSAEVLRSAENEKENIDFYEEKFGAINGDIEENYFWTHYGSKISLPKDLLERVIIPECYKNVNILPLIQLIAGSLSSSYKLKPSPEGIEVSVKVKTEEKTITKSLSELSLIQLDRLVTIYLSEQINMTLLREEFSLNPKATKEEKEKIKKFKKKVENLNIYYGFVKNN